MRVSRLFVLLGAVVALGACHDDSVTSLNAPPLAGVRYINALPDTFDVDIHPIDQVDWSAKAIDLAFRSGTEHQPMEAGKPREIRVFTQPGEGGATVDAVSTILVDTTITFDENVNYTLLLTGSARAGTAHFVVITDSPAADEGHIQLRALNANGGAPVDVYTTAASTDPLPTSPTFAGVASDAATDYAPPQDAGDVFAQAFAAGTTTPALASKAGPTSSTVSGERPAAGVNVPGSAFSIVYFPASVAGSAAAQFTAPGVVYFVDRNPGATQGPSQ